MPLEVVDRALAKEQIILSAGAWMQHPVGGATSSIAVGRRNG